MMTPLSVTASNTIGTSDPTTVTIGEPGDVGMVNIACGAVELINQCNVTCNALADVMALPISYTIYYYGKNITSNIVLADAPMTTINLPAVDSDVVTARNHFASGPSSNIAVGQIMSSSITNAMATLDAPNEYRTLYSITVNCTISPNSTDDTCEVIWLLLMINFLQLKYQTKQLQW